MKFNEKLLDLRKKKGLSQDEMGYELGVSRQTISKWESGQSYPDFQKLVLISDYFELSLDELIKGVDIQEVRDKDISAKQMNALSHNVEEVKGYFTQIKKWSVALGWFMIISFIVVYLIKIFLL